MRFAHLVIACVALGAATAGVRAAETCTSRADACDRTCAARPSVYPYTSRYDRCAESCQPRWQQCLRTGVWVHLEGPNAGLRERVDRFF